MLFQKETAPQGHLPSWSQVAPGLIPSPCSTTCLPHSHHLTRSPWLLIFLVAYYIVNSLGPDTVFFWFGTHKAWCILGRYPINNYENLHYKKGRPRCWINKYTPQSGITSRIYLVGCQSPQSWVEAEPRYLFPCQQRCPWGEIINRHIEEAFSITLHPPWTPASGS